MPQSDPRGVQPLRPLTLGELLDAAVALLRTHGPTFLTVAAVLAIIEQVALYPLRQAAAASPPWYQPYDGRLGEYWLLFGTGLATEAVAIALLGGLTARAAAPALFGERLPARALLRLRGSRLPAVVAFALIAGLVVWICALAGLLPWVVGYGLIGLAVPVLMVDKLGPARSLWRSVVLSTRIGMRACWIRIAGYLGWLAIRLALAIGGPALLYELFGGDQRWFPFVAMGTAAAVNAVAYATLACLDAALHLETRMRVEGLDISLARASRQGQASVDRLAVVP